MRGWPDSSRHGSSNVFTARMKTIGPLTMGLLALLPPPFPLTAFTLTSGALKVPMTRFLLVFGAARLFRFGTEALLARRFGTSLLRLFESEPVQRIAIGLVIVAVAGTAITIVRVWRSATVTITPLTAFTVRSLR